MLVANKMWAFLILLLCMNTSLCRCLDKEDVIFAVNAGGDAHVDSYGILYQRDFNKVGTESDYGKKLSIQRVKPHDQILYQTERYSQTTFGYDIPIMQDGDYVMVLKFSEVYFTNSGLKVFDVLLNGQHIVVPLLDIYDKVGFGSAHDEYIEFTVDGTTLYWRGEISEIKGNLVRVDFIKGERDNPKVNAVLVARGRISDIPRLPDLYSEIEPQPPDEIEVEEDQPVNEAGKEPVKIVQHSRNPSGPKAPDPQDVNSMKLMPIFGALIAFLGALLLLCRL
ncbi:Malectin [Cinara cedri]|uniref:Malectin n=1 Tax=Cinara cedri TaxID=506608 RepID=A0A5E4N3I3_9HEMI|nr:Malectin [Cinara cedri]